MCLIASYCILLRLIAPRCALRREKRRPGKTRLGRALLRLIAPYRGLLHLVAVKWELRTRSGTRGPCPVAPRRALLRCNTVTSGPRYCALLRWNCGLLRCNCALLRCNNVASGRRGRPGRCSFDCHRNCGFQPQLRLAHRNCGLHTAIAVFTPQLRLSHRNCGESRNCGKNRNCIHRRRLSTSDGTTPLPGPGSREK